LLKPINPHIVATIEKTKTEIIRLEGEVEKAKQGLTDAFNNSSLTQEHDKYRELMAQVDNYQNGVNQLDKNNPNPVKTYEQIKVDEEMRRAQQAAVEQLQIDRERAAYGDQFGREEEPTFGPRL
jgi:uncharacterized short protein YbdD (DUF466 family)